MITKNTPIGEILDKYPETVETLFKFGLHCLGCPGKRFETIGNGLKIHGMNDKEIEEAIKELNKVIKVKK